MRIGRIGYRNCNPVYAAMDRGVVEGPGDFVTGTPAELNNLLAAGELGVSFVSAVEYARNAKSYHLLSDLAISCDGPVRSVALFSRRDVKELEIDENLFVQRHQPVQQLEISSRHHQLETELEELHRVTQFDRQGARPTGVGNIHREYQPLFGENSVTHKRACSCC